MLDIDTRILAILIGFAFLVVLMHDRAAQRKDERRMTLALAAQNAARDFADAIAEFVEESR